MDKMKNFREYQKTYKSSISYVTLQLHYIIFVNQKEVDKTTSFFWNILFLFLIVHFQIIY